ncbi:uncharacterized protein PAC_15000 [Phialocephala subalpina]|uniref:Heterokaryon incompatibility domain-containing protein n=1 Tax=Phialocephala subalpina TaxID=576137 RepID=A0A1L7XJ76_9HELO|nr:uncharacterized protein PAC_15000 [Phialocephala subalpina]
MVQIPLESGKSTNTVQSTPYSSIQYASYSTITYAHRPVKRPDPPQDDIYVPHYPYRPLDFDTHEFRLLTFNLGEHDSGWVPCSVEHASLIDPPPYIALSYCWGDPTNTTEMRIGDVGILITENLNSALIEVLTLMRDRGEHNVRIWADAVCINQEDGQERSQQVRNMRQIYSKAIEVIAFVGSADYQVVTEKTTSTTENREDLTLIGDVAVLSFLRGWKDRSQNDVRPDAPLSKMALAYLDQFFSQQYWNRVWIIQEITVAQKVLIVYGSLHFDWADVVAFLSSQSKQADKASRPKNLEYFGGRPVVPKAYDTTRHLLEFRERFFKRIPIGLFEAMALTLKAQATDPRDKIFALLGLCHDGSTFVPVPNYKQSLESIIADMSKTMLTLNKTLDLICLKGTLSACSEQNELPTWAPNWSALWFGHMTLQEKSLLRALKSPSVDTSTDGFTARGLKAKGHCLGTVLHLSSAMRPHNREQIIMEPRPPWISLTKSLHQNSKTRVYRDPPFDRLKMFYTLVRTLTMARLSERRKDYWDLSDSEWCFELLWTAEGRGSVEDLALIEWIDHNAWFKIGNLTLREWSRIETSRFNTSHSSQAMIGNHIKPKSKTSDTKKKRTIIRTPNQDTNNMLPFIDALHKVLSSGMRLAELDNTELAVSMAHPDTEEGDKIFQLDGCSVPVVLRKESTDADDKRYKVVGGAYVYDSKISRPTIIVQEILLI